MMAQRWYEKATVQAALVVAISAIIVALITGAFTWWSRPQVAELPAAIGCSLRPVEVDLESDSQRQFLWRIGPFLEAAGKPYLDRELAAIVMQTTDYGRLKLYSSDSRLQTLEFAIRNNGEIDLRGLKVRYYQAVWDHARRGILMTAMNAEIDASDAMSPPRDFHERGPARDWMIIDRLGIGSVARKFTYPPVSLQNKNHNLADALVFDVSFRNPSSDEVLTEQCVFMVRSGSVHLNQAYNSYPDASAFRRELRLLSERLESEIKSREPSSR